MSYADYKSEFPALKPPVDHGPLSSSNCYGYRSGDHFSDIAEDQSDDWSDVGSELDDSDLESYGLEVQEIYFALSQLDPNYDVFSDESGRNERYLVRGEIVGRFCEKAYVNHDDALALCRAYTAASRAVCDSLDAVGDLLQEGVIGHGHHPDSEIELSGLSEVPLVLTGIISRDPFMGSHHKLVAHGLPFGTKLGSIHPTDGFIVPKNSDTYDIIRAYMGESSHEGIAVNSSDLLLSRTTVCRILIDTVRETKRIWPGRSPSGRQKLLAERATIGKSTDFEHFDMLPEVPPDIVLKDF